MQVVWELDNLAQLGGNKLDIATLNDLNDSICGSFCSTILRLSASICGLPRKSLRTAI